MRIFSCISVACACFAPLAVRGVASEAAPRLPKVVCASPYALANAKVRLAAVDSTLQPALDQLLSEADEALDMKPPSVMDKKRIPPSGDKHDFVSQAPYYWRDTNSPDDHYIHRDGQRNPEANKDSDAGNFGQVCSSAHTLALAFYFTGNEKYADKASELLRIWFLHPDTRMNPNVNYGQGIPGRVEGRPEGIISTRGLVELMDGLGILNESKSWTAADQQAMTDWLRQYVLWLTTAPLALREGRAANNHGTFYDTQVAAITLFLGKTNVTRELLLKDCENRIARQIEPDGRQPRELTRTLSFDYSLFNLRALFDLASIGQNAGVDLWHFQTPDGRSILKALKFMAAYADPKMEWPYTQIHNPNRENLADLLLRASAVYHDTGIDKALENYSAGKLAKNPINLLFATPANIGVGFTNSNNSENSLLQGASLLDRTPRDAAATAVPDAHLDYSPGKAPEFWSVAAAETVMARWPDYSKAYFNAWTYVNGYELLGFEMLYRATGDKKYFDYAKRYIDQFIDKNGHFVGVANTKGRTNTPSFGNLDNMMTGNTVVMLYEYTKDPRYRKAAQTIRRAFDDYPSNRDGGFWHSKRLNGQQWIDGIFMGQMFLIRYGKSIGDSQYCWDEATKQICTYARRAERDHSGLYVHGVFEPGHGGKFPKWADAKTGLSSEVWSEGLGWYALVTVETLADLPKDHPRRAEVEDIFRRLAAGLKRTQDPESGRWFQVVDKGDRPGNWTDTSGSAMFTYAIARGIELGLLDKSEYEPVVEKGYKGITESARINQAGLVDIYSACDGVGVQDSYDRYINYRQSVNAKEADAGFLWATAIVEKPRLEKLRSKSHAQ